MFIDLLDITVATLAGGTMEAEYLQVVKKYAGEHQREALGHFAEAFQIIISNPDHDVVGDVYQGAITYGEHGQYFTPETVCDLMAQMSSHDIGNEPEGDPDKPFRVLDPACGSGRMLMRYNRASKRRCWFEAIDIDHRCAKMAAINFALRDMEGRVTCGNSLTLECRFAYQIGQFLGPERLGLIRTCKPIEYVPDTPTAAPIAAALPIVGVVQPTLFDGVE